MWLKRNDAKRFICMIITIVLSVYPMSLSPVWNGKIPGHRDQYERMAQSILHGHLYLEYEDVDPRLSEMENPYDPQARKELGIYYHWDHAFYNGKYYMYFGIVPVVLLFLPYQLLTGNALTTYKATQIFTVGTILAIFALKCSSYEIIIIYLYRRRNRKRASLLTYHCHSAPDRDGFPMGDFCRQLPGLHTDRCFLYAHLTHSYHQ